MLLMVEKGVRGKICHAIYWCAKANYKYMKDYDKNTESSYLKDWYVNNLYGWTMPQKLPLGGFKWVENSSQFSKHFATMKIVRKDISSIWCLISRKITWPSKWFTLFAWKNEN